MRSKLRNDLLNEIIVNIVGYDDDGEAKVYFLCAPETTKGAYIEYEIYDEQEVYYDENSGKAIEYFIQVDIFHPGDYSLLEKAVKEVLKNSGYDGGRGPDLYEKETKLYHKPLRFTYTEINDN